MRFWGLALVLLTGCTLQVAPPIRTGPSPDAKSSLKPAILATPGSPGQSPEALVQPPFTGIWTHASDPAVPGPIRQDACAKYRRYAFSSKNGVTVIKVTDANAGFQGFNFDYEDLVAQPGRDGLHWRFEGENFTPGPTDGPVPRAITYELDYDAKRRLLTGTRQLTGGKPEPITLVTTDNPAACPPVAPATAVPTPVASYAPDAVVLRLVSRGGMCATGSCSSETTVRADGRFSTQLNGTTPATGQLDPSLVQDYLLKVSETDFVALKAKPFTGTCPTAYDGNEFVYTFATPQGDEVIADCTYAVNLSEPVFAAAFKLRQAASKPQ